MVLVYELNLRTPPEFRLGILYVVPVLLVAWHDGLGWGIGFAGATSLLRFVIGIDQMPPDTPVAARAVKELAYVAGLGRRVGGRDLAAPVRTRDRTHPHRTHNDSPGCSCARLLPVAGRGDRRAF